LIVSGVSVLALALLSGCSARQPLPCPPPEIVRPVIPAALLVPPPTQAEWQAMERQAIETLTHPASEP
jgi:hypothetical protein